MLTEFTRRLYDGAPLAQAEMTAAIDAMMRGEVSAEDVRQFLLALRAKGETVEEIAGAAQALRRHMTCITTHRQGVVDTCGTGGIGSELFNISTTAGLVAAAAGVPVAKHGNRSVTSKSGSADVLAELGVNIDAAPAVVERCLDELGICFCFAPRQHPAMKNVAAIRKELGRTIFNLLGPLCNPAQAPFQVMGVGRPELRRKLAEVLALLGTKRAVVVTGDDGLGEITLSTTTQVVEVRGGKLREFVWTPADFGLAAVGTQSLVVDGPAASAALVRKVLAGQPGPAREIVVANAAAALWVAGAGDSLTSCASTAAAAIDSGAARELLARLATLSHAPA